VLSFLADENFLGAITDGALRRDPNLDLVRVQDVGLAGASDPAILQWAARYGRVVLSHDVSTMSRYAYERVAAGLPMPGVFLVRESVAINATGVVIESLLLLAQSSLEREWEQQVVFLPL